LTEVAELSATYNFRGDEGDVRGRRSENGWLSCAGNFRCRSPGVL